VGVFQLESSGFRSFLKDLKPTRFEEIIAAEALYRPGTLGSGGVKSYVDRKTRQGNPWTTFMTT